MNLQPSARRNDRPVRLGNNHGYRFEGDLAFLNAELHVPPLCSGSNWALELWACDGPHAGGKPEGVKVAEVELELPTPIGPYLHRVEVQTDARPPARAGDHSMVLVLVGGSGEARQVFDFSNYSERQRFQSPHFDGNVGYEIEGEEVVLSATAVSSPRAPGTSTGTLCVELWALAEPYAGGTPVGHRLAGSELGSVWGQYQLPGVQRRVAFAAPPPGSWHVTLMLREWTLAHGYSTRDYRNFDVVYVRAAEPTVEHTSPAPEAPTDARPKASEAQPEASDARLSAALRLVKPVRNATPTPTPVALEVAAPSSEGARLGSLASNVAAALPAVETKPAPLVVEAAAPLRSLEAPAASVDKARTLSVQTASVDELARLPGLNLKIAKEIVKSRPITSFEALLQVRGIGEKTLRRLKALLSL